jgi:hypothetical protein
MDGRLTNRLYLMKTRRFPTLAVGLALALGQVPTLAQSANPVDRSQVCVTNGEIVKQSVDKFVIESPSSRAVVKSSDDDFAAIEFEYLGPTSNDATSASGTIVRQLGLKLHARDSCNVIYVMWNTDPDIGVRISTKINPTKSGHAQCGRKGYKLIHQSKPGEIPAIRIGEARRLEATLKDRIMTVKIDDMAVWHGDVGADAVKSAGYSGIRTDNVRVRFKWLTAPQLPVDKAAKDAPKVHCRPVTARATVGQ